jgi:hypothetical protein
MSEQKQYTKEELEKELKQSHKDFAREYLVNGWNRVKAYQKAYPDCEYKSASASATRLLDDVRIQQYVDYLKADLEKTCHINKAMVLNEHKKIAFSSIAQLHNTWIELKDFQQLSNEQKECIESIETKVLKKNIGTRDEPEIIDVEYIKVKLYSKQSSLEAINKMMGYNEPDKIDHNVQGISITVNSDKLKDKLQNE